MGCRNKITKTALSPLTDKNSEFYVPPERYRTFMCSYLPQAKLNPLYKRAKYIFVHKSSESAHTFRLRGTNRRTRNYAISILTDDNHFFYNEYRTKHTVLSQLTSSNMSRVFLDGYIVDNNTRILLDSTIKVTNEPIRIFLAIVAKTVGINLCQRSMEAILRRLNATFNRKLVRPRNGRQFRMWHKAALTKKLVEGGWLDFIPKELLEQMLDHKQPLRRRNNIFFAAAGILYMFRTDMFRNQPSHQRTLQKTVPWVHASAATH